MTALIKKKSNLAEHFIRLSAKPLDIKYSNFSTEVTHRHYGLVIIYPSFSRRVVPRSVNNYSLSPGRCFERFKLKVPGQVWMERVMVPFLKTIMFVSLWSVTSTKWDIFTQLCFVLFCMEVLFLEYIFPEYFLGISILRRTFPHILI